MWDARNITIWSTYIYFLFSWQCHYSYKTVYKISCQIVHPQWDAVSSRHPSCVQGTRICLHGYRHHFFIGSNGLGQTFSNYSNRPAALTKQQRHVTLYVIIMIVMYSISVQEPNLACCMISKWVDFWFDSQRALLHQGESLVLHAANLIFSQRRKITTLLSFASWHTWKFNIPYPM